jgi:hypothetical protein
MGNEAAGIIPVKQNFPGGQQQTPAHPDCHCTVKYLPDKTPAAERIHNKQIENTKERIANAERK